MVVDLSQAYTPGVPFNAQPIGFLQLPTGAGDVTVYGTTALVATGSNILLVNLANPIQPQLAGQVAGNFGNWLALTQKGVVLGTAPPSSGSDSSVQTSILGPAVLTACQSPLPAYLSRELHDSCDWRDTTADFGEFCFQAD